MSYRLVGVLIAVSTVLSVALAVAVNVATGGSLPGPLHGYEWLSWPVVGLLVVAAVVVGVWQVVASARGTGEPRRERFGGTPGSTRVRPAELPPYTHEVIGREREFAELWARVPALPDAGPGAPVVLVISGQPGVGKSGLAVRLAHRAAARYPDGQLFVELRGASAEPADPDEAIRRLLHTLGVAADAVPEDTTTRRALYRSLLADQRVLLLLDDAGSEAQVHALVPGARGCLVIVTSRRPVLTHSTASCRLDVLDAAAAVRLLAVTAGEERVAAEPEAAREVVERCGRLPLAVRIAGHRLRTRPTWTIAALAARLADERRLLDELRVGDRDVRTSFALSYADLDLVAARLFRRLGLLGYAEFGPGAASALLGDGVPRENGEAALERLADAQLVEVVEAGHYRLHDLLRVFAMERLEAEERPEDQRAAARRMLTRYDRRTREMEDQLTRPESTDEERARAATWLELQRPVLVAAVRRAADLGEGETAWRLSAALAPFLIRRGYPVDLAVVAEVARDAARAEGNHRVLAAALCDLGVSAWQQERTAEAAAHYEESLRLFTEIGDAAGQARVWRSIGELRRTRHEDAEAAEAFQRATECLEQSS